MSIIIFCQSCSFPEGNAATNRVHTYAKGFTELGIQVHVIVFGNYYLAEGNGIINGIYYYHSFGQKKRSRYFLKRRWLKFIKYFRTYRLIKEINKKEKVTLINGWAGQIIVQLYLLTISRVIKSKMIIEMNEHPLRKFQHNFIRRQQGTLHVKLKAILCDGMFCISQYLVDFYKNRNVASKKLFLVPGTVDVERFEIVTPPPFTFPYIAYCGSLTIIKDGVHILVESFFRIKDIDPELHLVLIGKGDTMEEETHIKELVKKLGIENRVIFQGQTPREKVPEFLMHASILALARPRSIVADAGFPSKLTEYLACAVPVVVTNVGDIGYYLKDKENAFIAEPDNAEDFASKIKEILSNYAFAKEVAKRGQELTKTIFNYHYQAERMLHYINSN
jgi:glycosyltransferase involved in cell wall biosynthesis